RNPACSNSKLVTSRMEPSSSTNSRFASTRQPYARATHAAGAGTLSPLVGGQTISLSWQEVRARRLRRSLLTSRVPAAGLVDAVGQICGLQAQVMTAAEMGLGSRVRGATRSSVRRALWEDRTLVKTWTLRGTLHLHPARELGMWLAARRATRSWREGQWYA